MSHPFPSITISQCQEELCILYHDFSLYATKKRVKFMKYEKKVPAEARRDAVRLNSSKHLELDAYSRNLRIAEVPDVQLHRVVHGELDMLGPERMAYEAAFQQSTELNELAKADYYDEDEYEPLKIATIFDARHATITNRKVLAAFDGEFERLLTKDVTLSDYFAANGLCPMTLAEYLIAEVEVCQELRPNCRTEFTLTLYVSDGRETRMFTFSEDEAVKIDDEVNAEIIRQEEYEAWQHDVECESGVYDVASW